jgi:hypothetical protein
VQAGNAPARQVAGRRWVGIVGRDLRDGISAAAAGECSAEVSERSPIPGSISRAARGHGGGRQHPGAPYGFGSAAPDPHPARRDTDRIHLHPRSQAIEARLCEHALGSPEKGPPSAAFARETGR